jgi:hypothetical protein
VWWWAQDVGVTDEEARDEVVGRTITAVCFVQDFIEVHFEDDLILSVSDVLKRPGRTVPASAVVAFNLEHAQRSDVSAGPVPACTGFPQSRDGTRVRPGLEAVLVLVASRGVV